MTDFFHHLNEDIVYGHLNLQTQCIAGVLSIQHVFIVDVELRNGGHGFFILRDILVLLSLLHRLLLYVVQFLSGTNQGYFF